MASRSDVADALEKFLECARLPVVGTFQAAGAVSQSHVALYRGGVGQIANQPADRLLDRSYCVVTIGYDEVEYWPSMWNQNNDRPIIHVDVVPATIQTSYQPSVELIGDIPTIIASLQTGFGQRPLDPASVALLQSIAADREAYMKRAASLDGNPIHPLRIISELQDMLSSDMTVCSDMGSFSIYLSHYLHSFKARQLLISNGQQTLGVALPWAIAAGLVHPREKVLSISGDGGFLFSANELETAVRLKSNLVHMIWIDGTYNMVGVQERLKYGRQSGVEFGPVDYVKYAEACGAESLSIADSGKIGSTLREAFSMQGPVLVSVNVDHSDNARQFEHLRHNSIQ
jgi:acetolactate synthase-1/2/3 large subunit